MQEAYVTSHCIIVITQLTLDHSIMMTIVRWDIRVRNLAGIRPPAIKTIVPAEGTYISLEPEKLIYYASSSVF